ncbi:hypothetical protein MLD38_008153 [Melastoma candidum]|uniref:Uncharacterized protein n=1 Tax=Melastoma candidum TaxID=119954 RepID=A0ACB9RSU4_9MYRT|nr:hypothetical protein MLD38_008153 [Melastoma candidum]
MDSILGIVLVFHDLIVSSDLMTRKPAGCEHHVQPTLAKFCFCMPSTNSRLTFVIPATSTQTIPHSGQTSAPSPRNFTLIVKVLAYNRLPSLSRCLRSLSAADYLSDIVHLHIYLDHFRLPSDSPSHDLNASNEILEFVDKFRWRFGEKVVHYRTTNVGLKVSSGLEAWWPNDDRG